MANRAPARTDVGVLARAHEDAGTRSRGPRRRRPRSRPSATVVTSSADSQLMIAPSRLPPGQAQHALAQRGDEDRRRLLGPDAEAEALDLERVVLLGDLLAASARRAGTAPRRGPSCTARRTARRSSARRSRCCDEPMPMAKPAGRGVGQRRHALGQAGRRAGVRGHDRRAEAQAGLPRRGQRQRREGVGAVGLGRPDVGVAEVGQLGQLVAVGVERARAAARSSRVGSAVHVITLRSAAGSVRTRRPLPSRTARCSSGWRWRAACRPRRTCARGRGRSRARRRATWMSSSTHSVGTSCDDAQRVVEAVAAAADAERLADAHRHEVAEHGQGGGVDAVEHLGDARPQQRPAVARRAVEVAPRRGPWPAAGRAGR